MSRLGAEDACEAGSSWSWDDAHAVNMHVFYVRVLDMDQGLRLGAVVLGYKRYIPTWFLDPLICTSKHPRKMTKATVHLT